MPDITNPSKVIQVDFGRELNESARKLARLLKLRDDFNEDIQQNPKKYLDKAHDEIVALQLEMRQLRDTMFPLLPSSFFEPEQAPEWRTFETVSVTREDYDRMKACEAIVREWQRF